MTSAPLRYRGPRHLDRTLALELGEVAVEGVALEFDVQRTIDGGLEALLGGACDIAEIPLGAAMALVAAGDQRVTALPLFLSRRFPHRFLWVATDARAEKLTDLSRCRIGWAPGSGAAACWTRHLLHTTGVTAEYVLGAMGGSMAAVLDLGRQPDGETLPERVLTGKLDALATPYPVPAAEGGDRLRPLLGERGDAERAWVREGGYLPMTTVVAMRRTAGDAGVSKIALMDAFEAARQAGQERLRYPGAPAVALPWLEDDLAELDDLFGGDAFPHGFAANVPALSAFADQCGSLGITSRRVEPVELFDAETSAWRPG